jgi:hypothetical protein
MVMKASVFPDTHWALPTLQARTMGPAPRPRHLLDFPREGKERVKGTRAVLAAPSAVAPLLSGCPLAPSRLTTSAPCELEVMLPDLVWLWSRWAQRSSGRGKEVARRGLSGARGLQPQHGLPEVVGLGSRLRGPPKYRGPMQLGFGSSCASSQSLKSY